MSTEITAVRDMVIRLDRYPHLRDDEPIGNGVALLLQNSSADGMHLHFEEALVVNGDGDLVGHLTVENILASFFPSILAPDQVTAYVGKKDQFTDLSILFEDSFRKECRRQAGKMVKQYMSKPRRVLDGAIHPLHALEIMVKEKAHSLPVSNDQELIGAVRITDLFRVLGTYCTM